MYDKLISIKIYKNIHITVNTWNEFSNGLHVDLWGCFQNNIFLFTPCANTILPMWMLASNGRLGYTLSGMALPGE